MVGRVGYFVGECLSERGAMCAIEAAIQCVCGK
jgi:hypothetical protein